MSEDSIDAIAVVASSIDREEDEDRKIAASSMRSPYILAIDNHRHDYKLENFGLRLPSRHCLGTMTIACLGITMAARE